MRRTPPILAPHTVIGHHGCSRDVAVSILDSGFHPSRNTWDWLGMGVYFWEWAPHRAYRWAELRSDEPVVLEAHIRVGDCLNLQDTRFMAPLREAYAEEVERLSAVGRSLPRNRGKAHDLDCYMIDFFCDKMELEQGRRFQTVRGAFEEGQELWERSRIRDETHVQIAVRDARCIMDVRLVHWRF